MARVRLDLRSLPGTGWPARPALRLFAQAGFGRAAARPQAVVDTGAPYPVLHWRLWREVPAVRGAVTFDPPPPTLPTLHIAGRRYSYRWGRLPITLHDWAGGPPLPPVEVLCQLCVSRVETPAEQSDPRRKPDLSAPVLGLGGGLFTGRYLTLTPGPTPAAWVQDAPPL